MKRLKVVALADLHCGHRQGLRPPGWEQDAQSEEAWSRYEALLKKHRRPDVVMVLGDAIDGSGSKSGGCELVTADRLEQAEMAVDCLHRWAPAKGFYMVRGTPYHTGAGEQYEDVVSAQLKRVAPTMIADRLQVKVGGVTFDLAHKVGSSAVPHGRWTAPARAALWALIQAADGECERPDVLLRGHVHYHVFGGAVGRLFATCPSLQWSSRFGRQQVGTTTHWGLLWFVVGNGRIESWGAECLTLSSQCLPLVNVS